MQRNDRILQAILVCTNPDCRCEYPVIDGVPVIVSNIREYVQQAGFSILMREDLSQELESLAGDCMGPGSAYDTLRQHISTYGYDHYGDLCSGPDSEALQPGPGSVMRLLTGCLDEMGPLVKGPVIDMGCAVGRTSFELARRYDTLVLGVDLSFPMLRAACRVLETGTFTYLKRRVGVVYDRQTIETGFGRDNRVDFWVCDVLNLPFRNAVFSFGASLNLLDCVADPFGHVREMERVLAPGAGAVIASPYDWNVSVSPVERWIGGHSQRSPAKGDSKTVFRSLFETRGTTGGDTSLTPVFEIPHMPWNVRVHQRSCVGYSVHAMGVKKERLHD